MKKRNEIESCYQWKMNDLYETNELWEKSFESLKEKIPDLSHFKGLLGKGKLAECLQAREELSIELNRLYVYAHMKLHEDMGESIYQGYADRSEGLSVKLSAATAFIEPEMLEMEEEAFLALTKDSALSLYKHYIEDVCRQKAHILSQELEEILANAHEVGNGADTIFSMINDADMKFGTVLDENGVETELTHARYRAFMESENRTVREAAFKKLYEAYYKQKNTLAATYNASVKADIFFAKTRKYNSSMEASLFGNNIPLEVYKNLVDTIHEYLPLMHRYVDLRKKRLGVSELHMYDIYAPIVKEVDAKVNYEEAKALVLKGLAPLGEDYLSGIKEGFEKGWIDVYENEGKHSGAYCWGAYGSHPFVLLNYENKLDDCFTLAHEMGHAMHNYYTWKHQPPIYSDYTMFLAEVASTVNEALLMEHLLQDTKEKAKKEYLINQFLEQFKGTMFRQTMFAEFELMTHEMAEKGEPLTVNALCELYKGLNEKYFGKNIIIDEQIAMEWSRIPHFYSAFYVYQYATGFAASMALSQKILKSPDAAKDYIEFLKSGSSDYSINILKKAGVDMSGPEPIRDSMALFERLIGELEI